MLSKNCQDLHLIIKPGVVIVTCKSGAVFDSRRVQVNKPKPTPLTKIRKCEGVKPGREQNYFLTDREIILFCGQYARNGKKHQPR